MIPVTQTFLPPIEEYNSYVQRAFNNGWLTNRGELVNELEVKLAEFLFLKESSILCVNNGTIALQIALKLLGDNGEVITTPFSYVASTSSIVWENCTPVFVDINPEYFTIDETKIEAAITDRTTCILATHVFGNPCNIEEIERIATKYNLKVIYDASHCFNVKYKGKSIFEYGDISTCSFHATKIFHTGEGGAIFTKNNELFEKIYLSHAFGHIGDEYFSVGINAKMTELSAAMGLAVLPYVKDLINRRRIQFEFYFTHITSDKIKKIKIREGTDWNYAYFPVVFENENVMLAQKNKLKENNVYPRRYFYPSLNTLSYLDYIEMKRSEKVSSSILCLPMFYALTNNDQYSIVNLID